MVLTDLGLNKDKKKNQDSLGKMQNTEKPAVIVGIHDQTTTGLTLYETI